MKALISSVTLMAVFAGGPVALAADPAFSPMASGTTLSLIGVWGASPRDVFAVRDGGTILQYDGAAWKAMESGTAVMFFRMWGRAADDVYVTGERGTLLHYDGSSWRPTPTGTTESIYTVWGKGPEVFVVGAGGTILRRSPASSSIGSPGDRLWPWPASTPSAALGSGLASLGRRAGRRPPQAGASTIRT